MTDKQFSLLFFGLVNSFTTGMTWLTFSAGVMEGFAICLIVSIMIAMVSIFSIYEEFNA